MSQIKSFAKKNNQSNLLHQEILSSQKDVNIEDRNLLNMIRHCPTRYISELNTTHRFMKLLSHILNGLLAR